MFTPDQARIPITIIQASFTPISTVFLVIRTRVIRTML
jgi:hypothetical protein